MKLPAGLTIVSFDKKQAKVRLNLPIGGSFGVGGAPAAADILNSLNVPSKPSAVNSFFLDTTVNVDSSGPDIKTIEDLKPQASDYIYPLFRALSATIIEDYWMDFTKPGVLEESVPLLLNQTVYKNHDFEDVEKWLGVVNQSVWDPRGDKTDGVPGINVELKIDWKVNWRIARGLLMTPPAIHSCSVTVLTEFEYSHPQMAAEDKWKFYDLLGEEVDGEIVRFIVTKILAYWEISLVFQGADGIAKQIDDVADEERADFRARGSRSQFQPATQPPATVKEKHTVKLSPEQRKALGLEARTEEDLPESVVLGAIETLAAQAAAGETLMGSARAECLRVAELAEADADGKLPAALAEVINGANATQLASLTTMYATKAAEKFTTRCKKCGSTEVDNRSSVESEPDVPVSYGVNVPSGGSTLFN